MHSRAGKMLHIDAKVFVILALGAILIGWGISKIDKIPLPFFNKINTIIGTWEGVNRPSDGEPEGICVTFKKNKTGIWHTFTPDFSMDHFRLDFTWEIKGSDLETTFEEEVRDGSKEISYYIKIKDSDTILIGDSKDDPNPLILKRIIHWRENQRPKRFVGSWKAIDPSGEIGMVLLNQDGTGEIVVFDYLGEKKESQKCEWGITQDNQFVHADKGQELRFTYHFSDDGTQFEITRLTRDEDEERITFTRASKEEIIREIKKSSAKPSRVTIETKLYLSCYNPTTGEHGIKCGPPITEVPVGKAMILEININNIDPSKSHVIQTSSWSTYDGNFDPKPNEWDIWGTLECQERIPAGVTFHQTNIFGQIIGMAGWWTGKKKVDIYWDDKLVKTFYFDSVPRNN